ncbi:MAG: hypothetical protein JWQ96_3284 [Segetibacter sp.]|nr:hypothetical protein [Segetibacter sp.]
MKAPLFLLSATLFQVAAIGQTTSPDTGRLIPVTVSYTTRDVEYHNFHHTVKYKSTLTVPTGRRRTFPAIVLVSTNAYENVVQKISDDRRLEAFAGELTRAGYITLRIYERNGVPVQNDSSLMPFDIVKDVNNSVDYLKQKREVDKSKLGIIGHSAGGTIASMIASIRDDINFVVMLGAAGEQTTKVLSDQNRALLLSKGIPSETINAYIPLLEQMISVFNQYEQLGVRDSIVRFLDNWMNKTPRNIVSATTGIVDENKKEEFVNNFVKTYGSAWTRYLLNYNPETTLRGTNSKMLALIGEKDVQILARPNLTAIDAALRKSNSTKYEVKELPGLNHLFQKCRVCTVEEYKDLDQIFSPMALEVVTAWLKVNVKEVSTKRKNR